MAQVFISYRRDDTAGQAGRLAHDLIERFGRGSVFMDIDAISPGVDFEQRIHEALTACDVVLVLIGDEWMSARTPDGRRRLEQAEDFVRKEVAAALARDDVTVVPVLVEGTPMPPPGELPDDVSPLVRRNAFELSNSRWDYDVGRLAAVIEEAERRGPVGRLGRRVRRRWRPAAAIAGLGAAAAVAVVVAGGGGGSKPVDPAAKVAACERAHGMSRPDNVRAARAGESQADQPTSPNPAFNQKVHESCAWPPGRGADPDGYRAIVVTETNGPGDSEATGRNWADRIETSCGRVQVSYSFGSQGNFQRISPFSAQVGQVWGLLGGGGFSQIQDTNQLNLPFTPLRNEVTVLRNSSYRLDGVNCVS
jgi:hypothetical protein